MPVSFLGKHKPIAVLGLGTIAAPGYGPHSIANAWHSGSVPEPVPEWLLAGQEVRAISNFDPARWLKLRGMRPLSRTSQLACVAAAAALDFPSALPYDVSDLGVVLGTRWGSIEPLADFDRSAAQHGPHLVNPQHFPNVVVNAHAGYLGILFGLAGPNMTLCGAGAGMEAICQALDMLTLGQAEALLAGAAEGLGTTLLHGMAAKDLAHIPGEGAAFLLLAREAPENRPALARIVGYSCVTASTQADLEKARWAAIHGALAGYQINLLKAIWHAGDISQAFETPAFAKQSIQAIQPITGDCQSATGAIVAALAVADVMAGNGPVMATAFPPLGVQSALLIA